MLLTEEQMAEGDRGLISAALNFLFWGAGYYHAGIKRPFGRSWLVWPIIYVVYAFIGEPLVFNINSFGSNTTTTVPTGNSTTVTVSSAFNSFRGGLIRELAILAFLVLLIFIGLFLARDVYRKRAASSADPSAVPAAGAAIRSVIQRGTSQINAPNIEREPAVAFSLIGGILLILGSVYLTVLDWLSSQTFDIGGIKELEGVVLGALIVYLALVLKSRPSWRQPAGVFIIAMALVVLTTSTEYAVEFGLGFAIIGGGLAIASSPEAGKSENQ